MAHSSRNAGRVSPPQYFSSFSSIPHQNTFTRQPSFHRLQPSSSEELLQVTENCGGLSAVGIDSSTLSEQHSLFAVANNFVCAVSAMDKHVMIPNRLRDIRLPTEPANICHHSDTNITSNSTGQRSRHNSGQSMGAGSLAGGVSLSSECSDPVAESVTNTVGDEIGDMDMYSCYRLLNTLKHELLSTKAANDNCMCPTMANGGGESGESDSERDGSNRVTTPREDCVTFTAPRQSNSSSSPPSSSEAGSSACLADQAPLGQHFPACSCQLCSEHPTGIRRLSSTSADAVKHRFRLHLRGLVSILSQLTETANSVTNYYDRCLIPGCSQFSSNSQPCSSASSGAFSMTANMSPPFQTQGGVNGGEVTSNSLFQQSKLF